HCPLSPLPRRPPTLTRFPYTTLFRSGLYPLLEDNSCWFLVADLDGSTALVDALAVVKAARANGVPAGLELSQSGRGAHVRIFFRSEEHTSELQSRFDLVCRLLLEKKN